ncbi:MAG TPA: sigma-70 family RNA polymerase sigma factor [Gammaproteobacteria bacterium]|nr:sigma-70 family RNA polymerase sigma factor [Gammaproteobacteria bacterium]
MDDVASLIAQVKQGHIGVYEAIVRRFQDMAVGYGYARLGDFQLAEDAAQEAFIAAYFELPSLHDPQAFPGWFRRIVVKQIDRIRRKHRSALSLDNLSNIAGEQPDLAEMLVQQEVYDALLMAIQQLPVSQREVVTLFYIGAYSHSEISAFLDISRSTVKMRLYHARQRLQNQLASLIEERLSDQRPSRDTRFVRKIMSFQVTAKQIQAQKTVSITRRVFIGDLQAHLDGSIKQLMAYAQANNLLIAGLPFSIYHGAVSEDQDGSVEVCLPIAGDVHPSGDIRTQELPAVQLAYTITSLRQSIFPGVLNAYAAIKDWIAANQHQIAASPREIYLNFNRSIFSPTATLDDPCVEIAWPYQ